MNTGVAQKPKDQRQLLAPDSVGMEEPSYRYYQSLVLQSAYFTKSRDLSVLKTASNSSVMFNEKGYYGTIKENYFSSSDSKEEFFTNGIDCQEFNTYSPHFESLSQLNRAKDPFLPENRIPLPKLIVNSVTDAMSSIHAVGPVFEITGASSGHRRNERERHRVRSVNKGFEKLKKYLPCEKICSEREGKILGVQKKKFSKVDVLRSAILYIRHLQELLVTENSA